MEDKLIKLFLETSDFNKDEINLIKKRITKTFPSSEVVSIKERDIKGTISDVSDLTIPDSLKELFVDVLHKFIDPEEHIYKGTKEKILKKLEKEDIVGIKVASISPDPEDFNTKLKGLEYDPYCEDFIIGAGGYLSTWEKEKNNTNPLVIRGLGGTSQKALKHCIENNRDFYAIDTGYIQPGSKKEYHRVTKNALQNQGPIVERPLDRLKRLNWNYRKYTQGSKILICPPSEKVMKFYGENLDTWLDKIITEIKNNSDRPIEIRIKPPRSERVTTDTIWNALEDAYCLVTYNSIAATEALLYSVPAIALAPNAATVLCNTSINEINNLKIPTKDEVYAFAAHLSYCQFTSAELRSGYAYSILNESN